MKTNAFYELQGVTRVTHKQIKTLDLAQSRSAAPVALWFANTEPGAGVQADYILAALEALHEFKMPMGTTHLYAAPAGNHGRAALQVIYDK